MSHTVEVQSVPIRDIRALRSAIKELNKAGVNVELVQNEVPRLYYADQLQRHMGRKSEVCDYVIKVKDAYYDIGLIKKEDGTYAPVFDDYNYPSSQVPSSKNGKGPIRNYLGAPYSGSVQYWSGRRSDTEQSLHSIGKLLRLYSKHAVINAAQAKGYRVTKASVNKNGETVVEIAVP